MLPERIHFVGIGGSGMSALAKVLQEDGHQVSGSDIKLTPLVRRLVADGARLYEGHAAAHLGDAQLVVVTAALAEGNPEVAAAIEAGIPVVKRAELLGRLMANRRGIAVAGTHGKTTTSAMIAQILLETGADPTFLIGGEIRGLDTNARRGMGPWLVAEADEYDRSFLHLTPEVAVITNVEADHLDLYRDLTDVRAAFCQFARRVRSRLILCHDDPWLREWRPTDGGSSVEHYGLSGGAWRAEDVALDGEASRFRIVGVEEVNVRLAVPGRHNVQNAVGAVAAAYAAGVPVEAAGAALERFRGAKRRLEPVAELNGILVIDDYSHHPTEIRVALAALRAAYPGRRIVCLHQPHTYSRTKLLLNDFATAFGDADIVRIADIYPAREQDVWGIHASDLAAAIQHPDVRATGSVAESAAAVATELQPGDVLALIGAGDIAEAAPLVLERLRP